MSRATFHTMALVLAAVLFSTSGAAIKACTLAGPQIACLRAGVAAIAVALLLPEARTRWRGSTLAVGFSYAVGMSLFAIANKLTTAANAIYMQAASPLYILLLAPWLLREPARRRDVGFLVALAAGLFLLFLGTEQPVATAPNPARGNLFALLSSVSIAVMMIGLRRLARRGTGNEAAAAVLAGNVMACAMTLPAALPFPRISVSDALILVYLGVFQIAMAYALVTRALRHLPALEASMILLVEPVLNPIWAWLVEGEIPGTIARLGGAVILGAIAAKTIRDARDPTSSP